ncbi:MAG: lysine--tRNA ligase [Pirellulaceae bacterium]
MSDVPGGPRNQQSQGSDNDPRSLSDQQAARLEKLRRLEQSGIDPWGHRIDGRLLIDAARQQADRIVYRRSDGVEVALPEIVDGLDLKAWRAQQGTGEEVGPRVKIAGRIVLMRPTGKLVFLNLRDWSGDLQVLIGKGQVGEESFELTKLLDLGDWLAVEGRLGRTNTGELTVFADAIEFMTKTMEPPPEKHAGLADPELRQRMRYLDLTYNAGVMDTFRKRIKIVQSVRDTLNRHGYWEIEGPTLHAIAGGAAARPFTTHHNALNMPLFLRIALELHLKRLLVGGIERVYELGRVYRNEGISVRHNPEFTMMECYKAFANYETMMELTEQIIGDALRATGQPLKVTWGDLEIDFTPPFQRRTYADLFAEHARVDPEDADAIARLAKKLGLETAGKHPDVIKSEVFEETVEDQLKGPIFVIDYPASICPLTKRKTGKPEVAERFELFVHGMELANAYTELNDPLLQEQLFRTQLEGMAEEDSMAKMDHDFIRAMRHGMPPAGGLGIGIDRLVMLLTNSRSIRDIVLFPLLRHET